MLIAPRSCSTSSAAIVSRRMRLSANARSSAIDGVEVVAHHQHVEVLVDRVDGVGHRRVGRRRQEVRPRRRRAGCPAHGRRRRLRCGRRTACGPWWRRSCPRRSPISFSVSLWIDDLRVGLVGHRSGSSRSPPASCPSPRAASGRSRRPRPAGAAHRAGSRCPCRGSRGSSGSASAACSMRRDVLRPRRAGGREGAGGRAGAAAEHRRHAARQRLVDLLRADEVDVACRCRRR